MPKVLIVSPDVVDGRMAGSGIRCWEIARALSRYARVTLAAPGAAGLADSRIDLIAYDREGTVIREQLASADVVIVQGFVLHTFPYLKHLPQPLVVDLYDPFLFENLEAHRLRAVAHRYATHTRDLEVLLEQLRCGDFFLCSNERQRNFWLGMLSAIGRIALWGEHGDALHELVATVPFGLPDSPPKHTRQVLKGAVQGIREHDRVIVWGGGIWAWLDPLAVIHAMKMVAMAHPDARLFFMGKDHPNPDLSAIRGLSLYSEAVKLARDLGLLGRHVFFNDRWVDYQDRQNYLLEADIGVSFHQNSVETRYALRTRLLDYVWCGLPMVVSAGDTWSETIVAHDLGRVVPVGDVDALAAALNAMLGEPDLKARYQAGLNTVGGLLTWEKAIRPLAQFVTSPRKAAGVLPGAR